MITGRKRIDHTALLRRCIQTAGVKTFKRRRYRFDFNNGVYTMDGEKLRIRPAEALYLYERLVLKKHPGGTTCRYAVQRLRERFGPEFLVEYIDSKRPERKIRDSSFTRTLRTLMEKDGRTAYSEWGYEFDFLNGVYRWEGTELRVTPVEAVFLYERTVLGLRGRNKGAAGRAAGSGVLYTMRKKFRREFLGELFPLPRQVRGRRVY
jgi:hypothetical protein